MARRRREANTVEADLVIELELARPRPIRYPMRQVSRAVIVVLLLVVGPVVSAGAVASCTAGSVRRPIWHSERERNAVAKYKLAMVVPSEAGKNGRNREWKHTLPESAFGAVVGGREHLDIVTVHYPGAPEPLPVHPPEDYTNNLEIRVEGSTLYVYRVVTLVWTEYRLAIYDLSTRKLVMDVLVAPEDMPTPKGSRN
jgi:hypothetical protein